MEAQPGDPALGRGGLAVIPIEKMHGAFWELTGAEQVVDPRGWAVIVAVLSQDDVSVLGGEAVPIDSEGEFRVTAPAGEYAICYWPGAIGGRVTGCDALDLPAQGELDATWGEAGFHIDLAG